MIGTVSIWQTKLAVRNTTNRTAGIAANVMLLATVAVPFVWLAAQTIT